MDKMGYAPGLIKYSTENAMNQHWTKSQTLRHVLRPRILIYSTILLAVVVAMVVSLTLRTPFKVDVVRDRGVMARIVAKGDVENLYRLQLMNATEKPQIYKITATGLPGLKLTTDDTVEVASTESRWVTVRVVAPFGAAEPGSHVIQFGIESIGTHDKLTEKSSFIFPR